MNGICSRLHGRVDQPANAWKVGCFDAEYVRCRIAGDLRPSAGWVAIIRSERIACRLDLVAFADNFLDFRHHPRQLCAVFSGGLRSALGLRHNADIDLGLIGFHGNDGLAAGCHGRRTRTLIGWLRKSQRREEK
jgi:hypothetical protein